MVWLWLGMQVLSLIGKVANNLLHNLSIRKNGRNRALTEFITKNSLVIPCNKWGWVSNPSSPHKGDQAMTLNYKALGKQNR